MIPLLNNLLNPISVRKDKARIWTLMPNDSFTFLLTKNCLQAKYITDAEERYGNLLETLDPQLSSKYQRRCEEATKEGNFPTFKVRYESSLSLSWVHLCIITSGIFRWQGFRTPSWNMEYSTCDCKRGSISIPLSKY